MSFSQIFSAQTLYLKPHLISIETDTTRGLNSFSIVGLGDKAVDEAKDRVSAALKNSGLTSPKQKNQKVIISLAPAEVKKSGPVFDLGIALGYLLASKQMSFDPKGKLFLGELALDGSLRRVSGVLPIVRFAKEEGFREVFVPADNAREAAVVDGITIYGAEHLRDILNHLDPTLEEDLLGIPRTLTAQPKTTIRRKRPTEEDINLGDIVGQEGAKRGLEIAAAGGHNMLLFGEPGAGKTLLAKAFRSLLPKPTFNEMLEISSIHSVAGTLDGYLATNPPFRTPHHSASHVSIIGGGNIPKPGEMTLAHRGVLFLDEFPEFDRRVLESLREPLEERSITISRAQGSVTFPGNFILVAAMNPCPCGMRGTSKECRCQPRDLARYERKLSGPILDRIDLWLEVGRVGVGEINDQTQSKNREGEVARRRVVQARRRQAKRQRSHLNAHITAKHISTLYPQGSAREVLDNAAEKLGLSLRGYHKVVKVARTIADLDEAENISENHVLEALQYRSKPIFEEE